MKIALGDEGKKLASLAARDYFFDNPWKRAWFGHFTNLVPIERRSTYEDTRHFAEIVAGALATTHRGLVTTEWSKAKRRGVLIDANQNGEGKTIASVYSVRPKEGAPVSTPLRWDEVDDSLDPSAFTMDLVRKRVAEHGDLFEGVLKTRQSLSKALNALQ